MGLLRTAFRAAALSGIPSTLHALATGRDPLEAVYAAGSILLPREQSRGAAAGLAIAAFDLGVVGRLFPRVRALPLLPQLADHAVFGALAARGLGSRTAGLRHHPRPGRAPRRRAAASAGRL